MTTRTLESQGEKSSNGQKSDGFASNEAAKDATTSRLPFQEFIWGAGMECSFLPHLNVDQFEWTQHDRFWREDLRRAREELGMTHLRYALPWHVLGALARQV